jgi:hypothetical protein
MVPAGGIVAPKVPSPQQTGTWLKSTAQARPYPVLSTG